MNGWQDLAGMNPEQLSQHFGLGGYSEYFSAAPEGLLEMAGSEYWEPYRQQGMQFMQRDFSRGLAGLRSGYGQQMQGISQMGAGQGFAEGVGLSRLQRQTQMGAQQQYGGLQNVLGRGIFGLEQDILGRQQQAQMQGANWAAQQAQMALGLLGVGAEGRQGTGQDMEGYGGMALYGQREHALSPGEGSPFIQQDPADYITQEWFEGLRPSEQQYISQYQWAPNYWGPYGGP